MAKKKGNKVQVNYRALEARIIRLLAPQKKTIRRCREDSVWYADLGSCYTLDLEANCITAKHVDIEALGRELGVLKEWEELAR